MNLTELKNSKGLFWYIQLTAWFLFTILTLFIYYEKTFSDWFNAFFHVFEYSLGFAGSLLLRFILKHFNKKSVSLLSVSFTIIISALICGHFWLISANYFWMLFRNGVYSFNYAFSMSLAGYIFRIFWITLIYCGWGALYFFIKTWIDLQKQTEKTLTAQSMVREAQLQMLRYQLNPHFFSIH